MSCVRASIESQQGQHVADKADARLVLIKLSTRCSRSFRLIAASLARLASALAWLASADDGALQI